ncbi:MAG TPA: CPBP family intramembrane metalloprotease [Phycisphaerae bacterium]|nr:CPBP family intramembrane metalloprotease [Phycisphaerae bacterium]HRW55417.1 CPBP family intramembrane metalloprotease [Phycisphaerae bacterium]
MNFDLSHVPLADLIFLALGLIVIIVVVTRTTLRGSWVTVLQLPEPPAHTLNRIDVVLGAWVYVTLASLGAILARWMIEGGAIPTSQPADTAAIPSGAGLIGGALGAMGTATALLYIGAGRFEGGLKRWGIEFTRPGRKLFIAVCVTLAISPICYGILNLTDWLIHAVLHIEPAEHPSIETLRSAAVPVWMKAMIVLSAVVIAPIVEELLFRGMLLPSIAKRLRSPLLGLLISSLLFGLIHYRVAKTVPALFVFGIALGATYLRTRSLVVVILIHALFNLKTVVWIREGIGG